MPETPQVGTLLQSGQGIVGMKGPWQRPVLHVELALAIDLGELCGATLA
jgi:hypothetical protein